MQPQTAIPMDSKNGRCADPQNLLYAMVYRYRYILCQKFNSRIDAGADIYPRPSPRRFFVDSVKTAIWHDYSFNPFTCYVQLVSR